MPQGTIKKLVADKGFGFIDGERGDLFFHHSAVQGVTIEELRVGQQVSYEEGRGPKGPRAETYLYAPSDNIMVIPACYDADRAWKIAFAYNLFTNPTPGYTDSDDWKNGYYQKYRDERAVDETIAMMREPEHQFVWYSDMVTGYDLGSQYIWDVYAQATTPAEKAESMRGTWQAYIDEANAN